MIKYKFVIDDVTVHISEFNESGYKRWLDICGDNTGYVFGEDEVLAGHLIRTDSPEDLCEEIISEFNRYLPYYQKALTKYKKLKAFI